MQKETKLNILFKKNYRGFTSIIDTSNDSLLNEMCNYIDDHTGDLSLIIESEEEFFKQVIEMLENSVFYEKGYQESGCKMLYAKKWSEKNKVKYVATGLYVDFSFEGRSYCMGDDTVYITSIDELNDRELGIFLGDNYSKNGGSNYLIDDNLDLICDKYGEYEHDNDFEDLVKIECSIDDNKHGAQYSISREYFVYTSTGVKVFSNEYPTLLEEED